MSRIAGYFCSNGRQADPGLLERMAQAFNLPNPGIATATAEGFGVVLVEEGASLQEMQARIVDDEAGVIVLEGRGGRETGLRWRDDPIDFYGSLRGEALSGAHFDARRNTLSLFRDRFGTRAIYYTYRDGLFLFASEIKALLATGEGFGIDREMLARFLAMNYRMWYGRDKTWFADITELPVAGHAVVDRDGIRVNRYWSPPDDVYPDSVPDEVYASLYRTNLERSVAGALERSRERLFLVSGGLDSPLIAALASELLGERVDCCAAVFPSYDPFDESAYIRELTDRIGAKVILHELGAEELLRTFDDLLDRHDQPLLSAPYLLLFRLVQLAAETGYEHVFAGGGGDYVAQGTLEYNPYLLADYAAYGAEAYDREIDAWCTRVGPHLRYWPGTPGRLKALIERVVDFERPGVIRNNPDWVRLDRTGFGEALEDVELRAPPIGVRYGTYRQSRIAEDVLYQGVATHFVEDLNNATFSARVHEPFWDLDLFELGFQLPLPMLLRDGWTKYIVREAVRDTLPEKLLSRPDKAGLNVPVGEWFREGALAEAMEDVLSSASFRDSGFLDRDFVLNAFSEHRNGQVAHTDLLWKVFTLCRWAERWLQTGAAVGA